MVKLGSFKVKYGATAVPVGSPKSDVPQAAVGPSKSVYPASLHVGTQPEAGSIKDSEFQDDRSGFKSESQRPAAGPGSTSRASASLLAVQVYARADSGFHWHCQWQLQVQLEFEAVAVALPVPMLA